MKISSVARINFTVVALCIAAILYASVIGLVPDDRKLLAASRATLCESLATNVSFLVSKREYKQLAVQLDLFRRRNNSLISIGLRRDDGAILASVGEHQSHWESGLSAKNDGCYRVPILSGKRPWGHLEVQFQPLYGGTQLFLSPNVLRLLIFLVPLIGLACWLHLRKMLKYLDPSQAVPSRVRQTLDSFAEGVVLLDKGERIVLANDAFSRLFGKPVDDLNGLSLSEMPWFCIDHPFELPWVTTSKTYQMVNSTTLRLELPGQYPKIFSVNSSPVLDETGRFQGVMVALADVTPLELKRAELATTLEELNVSKEAITKQNEELRYLATRDPLTSCINRRTFFEQFEAFFNEAKDSDTPLCAMMVDIDFFKSINDNYGHSMGDDVLRSTGALLNECARKEDVVCRYGGEEFSVLMPGLSLEDAVAAAERIRIKMSEMVFPEFSITASLGLSEVALGAKDPQDLLDQADKCLYVAKRNGRNQVVRFDDVPEDLEIDESKISRTKLEDEDAGNNNIPFAAVTALLAALTYRDSQTGTHSARVSSYAALLAQRVLGPKEVYVVEMAALLHDIGKIGVPDAILLKPGKLDEEEWKVMERHDRIGVEIINKSFKNAQLTEIIEHHHARFDGTGTGGVQRAHTEIPIGARILTIADSFDAMVSDRPYRAGMPIADALVELRRCSGTQFDPDLVEVFCEIVDSGSMQSETCTVGVPNEVLLNIGEQIERIVDAADKGDKEMFLALTDRLRRIAEQSNIATLAEAASHAVEVASEDAQLEQLVQESFELLTVCRSMHSKITQSV